MLEEPEIIEVVLTPVPPDTMRSVKQEIVPLIEAKMREEGRDALLTSGLFTVQTEQTFPTDAETLTIVIAMSGMAKDTYKELILPLLKRRFGVEEKPLKKDDASNNKDRANKARHIEDADEDAEKNTE